MINPLKQNKNCFSPLSSAQFSTKQAPRTAEHRPSKYYTPHTHKNLNALETFLPKSSFTAANTWELDQEITQARTNHPASPQCSKGKIYECPHVCDKLITWPVTILESPRFINSWRQNTGGKPCWPIFKNVSSHAWNTTRTLPVRGFLPRPIPHHI